MTTCVSDPKAFPKHSLHVCIYWNVCTGGALVILLGKEGASGHYGWGPRSYLGGFSHPMGEPGSSYGGAQVMLWGVQVILWVRGGGPDQAGVIPGATA